MTTLRAGLLLACVALVAACGERAATGDATGTTAKATTLTEPQVRALVESVEAATGTKVDRKVTEAALVDEASVTWYMPGQPPEVLDKAAFLADIDQMETEIQDAKYTSRIGAVRIDADGTSASVDVAVSNNYLYDGTRVEETSDQVYTIELRDGAPKVVALQATVTALTVDGKPQF